MGADRDLRVCSATSSLRPALRLLQELLIANSMSGTPDAVPTDWMAAIGSGAKMLKSVVDLVNSAIQLFGDVVCFAAAYDDRVGAAVSAM
jgi:hypothetical protein